MIKSLVLDGLSFPEIDRAIRWQTFWTSLKVALVVLIIGISLGYAWRYEQSKRWDTEIAAYIKRLEIHRAHLVDRLSNAEGDCGKRIAGMRKR